MVQITVTEEQARLIQNALEFYARIGIGQFNNIIDHPTFDNFLDKHFAPQKEIEVGDDMMQGKVEEIKDGMVRLSGSFTGEIKEQTLPIEKLRFSPDYSKIHEVTDQANMYLHKARNLLIQDDKIPLHGSWGIHNKNVDDSCRVAYDILQVIRHEFWKKNPKRSLMTVDSDVMIHTEDGDNIKCEILEEEKEFK